MLSLYEKIEALCRQNNINITEMCKQSGTSRGSLTDLKRGRIKTLSAESIRKIADYFHVSTDYLLGNDQQKAPALTRKDEREIATELERIRTSLENADGLMFYGNPMTDEARESILAAMKLGLEAAKLKNKEKKAP